MRRLTRRNGVAVICVAIFALSCTDGDSSRQPAVQTLAPGADEDAHSVSIPSADTVTADVVGPMRQLVLSFETSSSPAAADLVGSWTLVRHVSTHDFGEPGTTGPDREVFEPNGIRRHSLPGAPLEWQMAFEIVEDSQVRVTSRTVWEPSDDSYIVEFNESGDAVFPKDYGGDGDWVYRCRAPTNERLVCLLQGHENKYGLEFWKLEPGSI
ncbi:MAG TPA: hypothetical protein VMN60_07350 [Longimicrobiales bacterium]|nr:hypothetical protein [Longimicrobiales bacterium]